MDLLGEIIRKCFGNSQAMSSTVLASWELTTALEGMEIERTMEMCRPTVPSGGSTTPVINDVCRSAYCHHPLIGIEKNKR